MAIKSILPIKNLFMETRPPAQRHELMRAMSFGDGNKATDAVPDVNDYKSHAEWYLTHDLMFAAIKTATDSLAGAKLVVEEKAKSSSEWGLVDGHPLELWAERPNPEMHQLDMLQAWYVHLTLYGVIRSVILRGQSFQRWKGSVDQHTSAPSPGKVVYTTPIHPGLLTPKRVKENTLQSPVRGFVWKDDKDEEYWIPSGDAMIDLIYDPEAYGRGVSPSRTLTYSLRLDVAMKRHIAKHFTRGGMPKGLVTVKYDPAREEPPSDEELDMMATRWSKRFGNDGEREGEVSFVSSDIEWVRISDRLDELTSDKLFDQVQIAVAAVTGVPAQLFLAGIRHGSVRANQAEANKAFFDQTIFPHLYRIGQKIQSVVLPSYLKDGDKGRFRVGWDLRSMALAQQRIIAEHDAVRKDWELGLITRNTALGKLGYAPASKEKGDEYYDTGSANGNATGSSSTRLPASGKATTANAA